MQAILLVAQALLAVLTPLEAIFEASAQAEQAERRRTLFRLPYDDPSRESRAQVIYDAEIHLQVGGLTKSLRRWVKRRGEMPARDHLA